MVTNPDYREDPWKESIAQALEVFDDVVVVCGQPRDQDRIERQFMTDRIHTVFLYWPQPDWSYEELARHLNIGLRECREINSDWVIKFDIDMFIHEKDKVILRQKLENLKNKNVMLGRFEKLQFFLADRAYEKGKIPLAVNMKYDIWYGSDNTRYTDLCQPILWDGETTKKLHIAKHEIPCGQPVDISNMESTGLHIWNYDYTFKTKERSTELLYNFDKAHARWWDAGYGGRQFTEITPETALAEYMNLVSGRIKKCNKFFEPKDHPKHVVDRIKNIKPEEFGHSLWDEIEFNGGGIKKDNFNHL